VTYGLQNTGLEQVGEAPLAFSRRNFGIQIDNSFDELTKLQAGLPLQFLWRIAATRRHSRAMIIAKNGK
jgi:hypothetical protein